MADRVRELFHLPEDAPHLEAALTHPSYANEQPEAVDNQRLEFFGDSILGFCVSELLMARFPDADEGELTRMRAAVVNGDVLARFARTQGLDRVLRLGRGAAASALGDGVLADMVEALLAAAYLDGGLDAARAACRVIVESEIESFSAGAFLDPKSELQERVQAIRGAAPTYELVSTRGPSHDPTFTVQVRVGDLTIGQGIGKSKKIAERVAAAAALSSGAWRDHAKTEELS